MKPSTLALAAVVLVGCASTAAPRPPARGERPVSLHDDAASSASSASSASPPPPPPPSPSPPRISLADVVKQAVPGAKRALIYAGGDEVIAELADAGIASERMTPGARDCVPNVFGRFDVVVADEVDQVHRCDERGAPTVSVSRKRTKVASIQPLGNVFVDERCAEEVCDAFYIYAENANRWFLRGDLPLTILHSSLTPNAPTATRVARGVLVDGALDLGDRTLLRVDGAPSLSKRDTVRRAELQGWWKTRAIDELPNEVRGIAEVRGDLRLEGRLGLGSIRFPPWNRPKDVPTELALLKSPGTLAVMTADHVDFVIDGPTLARLNANTNAALARASKLIAAGDLPRTLPPLRDALSTMRAVLGEGHEFGRARILADLIRGLEATQAAPAWKDRAYALATTFNQAWTQHFAPADLVFFDALYHRACDELAPIAELSDVAAARKAADVAWPMHEEHARGHVLFELLSRRFGPYRPSSPSAPRTP